MRAEAHSAAGACGATTRARAGARHPRQWRAASAAPRRCSHNLADVRHTHDTVLRARCCAGAVRNASAARAMRSGAGGAGVQTKCRQRRLKARPAKRAWAALELCEQMALRERVQRARSRAVLCEARKPSRQTVRYAVLLAATIRRGPATPSSHEMRTGTTAVLLPLRHACRVACTEHARHSCWDALNCAIRSPRARWMPSRRRTGTRAGRCRVHGWSDLVLRTEPSPTHRAGPRLSSADL